MCGAPPGLFSTMTGWPQLSVSFSPTMRGKISAVPPGASGTMILIGRLGIVGLRGAQRWRAAGEQRHGEQSGQEAPQAA